MNWLPIIVGALGNPTVQQLLLSAFTAANTAQSTPSQLAEEFRKDIVAIKLDDSIRNRVKAYQQEHRLESDGVPGPITLDHMLDRLGK
jgi:murein L,D-transpeptidase YcbB/YkuD